MSLGVVQKILGRMVAEREFRILVFTDPDKALAGYDLTEAEIKTLKGLSREKFDAAAANLDERVSMSAMASSLDDVQQTVKKAGAQPDDVLDQMNALQPGALKPVLNTNITEMISAKKVEKELKKRGFKG
jgi:predicted component of type VI protein secretion system